MGTAPFTALTYLSRGPYEKTHEGLPFQKADLYFASRFFVLYNTSCKAFFTAANLKKG